MKIKCKIGYVASVFDSPDNPLALKENETPPAHYQNSSDLFTRNMKRGKFLIPSNQWLKDFLTIENEFIKFHQPSGMNRGSNIEAKLLSLLSPKFPQYSEKILKLVLQLRTDTRIRSINLNVKIKKKKRLSERAQKKISNY